LSEPVERLGLSREWQTWVTQNALEGAPPQALIEALIEEGVPKELATKDVSVLINSAPFQEALRWRREAQRLKLMSRLMQTLRQGHGPQQIERVSGVGLAELQSRYLKLSQPVILTDVLSEAPALTLWSDEYLKRAAGDVVVSCCEGREAAESVVLFEPLVTQMSFGELIDRVAALKDSDDLYLIGNNRFFEREGTAKLLEDLGDELKRYVRGEALDPKRCWLWFGPQGTYTPLHHDRSSVLYAQLRGQKRFRLLSPFNLSAMMRLELGTFCEVSVEEAEAESDERAYDVVLKPGELLVLPAGWWHEVTSLSASISISITALDEPSHFPWYQLARV